MHLGSVPRRGPADGVPYDELDFLLVIRRERLVTRPEVEDPSFAAEETAARSEDVSPCEPADEHSGIRHGNVEPLPVHLFVGDFEAGSQPVDNRVPWLHDPQPLFLSRFAPAKEAGCPHEPHEGLGQVGGMKDDKAHALEDARMHGGSDFVAYLVVREVAPPDEHVGCSQHGVAQPMLGLIKGRGPYLEVRVLTKESGNRAVDPLRVDLRDLLVGLLVPVLVPYSDPDFPCHAECLLPGKA